MAQSIISRDRDCQLQSNFNGKCMIPGAVSNNDWDGVNDCFKYSSPFQKPRGGGYLISSPRDGKISNPYQENPP